MFVWVRKRLQYGRSDVSEGIDINNGGASKRPIICRYWCSKDISYKFEPNVCNGYVHEILMMADWLKNIAILNVKGIDIRGVV